MTTQPDLLQATVRISSAYLSKNSVASDQLGTVIRDVHGSLQALGNEKPEPAPAAPAVSIRRSVKNDAVTCLECGKPLKMLKRHLRVDHDLSVPEYKAKWGLSVDHPMVAPDYAQQRSEAAKRIGLGRKPTEKRPRRKASPKGVSSA